MKNRTYLRASMREIKQSLGRFVAIVLIIMLGTLLFVGVKTAGPVMQESMSYEVDQQNLSNLQIVSTGGLTQEDIDLAKSVEGASAEAGKMFYYANTKKSEVAQVFSFNEKSKQNQLRVTEGRLPKEKNEIVLDKKAMEDGYTLGQSYQFSNADELEQKSYKIVGFVDSPLFINELERGYTNVGNGTVDYFIYLPEDNFTTDVYSTLYLTFDNVQNLGTYSDEYVRQMEENQQKVERVFAERPDERLEELQTQGTDQLAPAKKQVTTGQEQVQSGEAQLATAQEQLDQQKTALEQLPEAQQEAAQTQIDTAQQQLDTQKQQLSEEKNKLADAQEEIKENEEKIATIETPKYVYNERSENVGFQEYGDLAERIAAIANVFPVFFFFIAALITFTTMTRMVEENRREIGTLKALGYTKFEISKKYTIYASMAAIIGLILGVILGTNLLPRIIFQLSSVQYTISNVQIFYDWLPILQAVIAFFIASLGSALFVLLKDLREKPAALLQPKAPKPGKRILLEYIPFLWSRFSFNQKISYRNLFRYKSRMIMAIIGIAGCAGLMVAGVGLKDSLGSVADKQFGPIVDYQAIVTLNDAASESDKANVEKELGSNQIKEKLPITMKNLDLKKTGHASQNVTMMVTDDAQDFSQYVHLKDTEGQKIALPKEGVVLTEKAAESFGLEIGDSLTLYDEQQREYKGIVQGITQNYLGSFVYLTKEYYQKISDQQFEANAYLLQTGSQTESEESQLAQDLLETGAVTNTSFISDQIKMQEDSMANLDAVVWIFVVLSGALAFIVLYNLTNINISERVRELSTIKVLGFFDKEVTMYIVRENIIFTILGILVGYVIGYFLTGFILMQASMESVVFPLVIRWPAYALSGGLTILFTVIVMIVTHFKLKHIDMIDALKSNE